MMNVRWGVSAFALGMMALSAYGCSSDVTVPDDDVADDDDDNGSSSGGKTSSSGGKSSSSGGKSSSSSSGGKSSSSGGGSTSSSGGESSSSSSGGSTSSSSGSIDPTPDAGPETLPDASTGDGGVDDAGVALSCPGNLGPVGYWDLAPGGDPGDCTTQNITDFAAACFGAASTTQACDAFFVAHPTCAGCIVGSDSRFGTIVPVRVGDDFSYLVNTDGCIARRADFDDDCTAYNTNATVCVFENCASCSDAAVDGCFTTAGEDSVNGCGQLYDLADQCYGTFGVTAQDLAACGSGPNITFEQAFPLTTAVMCGPSQ